jgi:hypothetical protein
MGFLKKLTRPISKVLDKIVPNEIKPALPFLSAAVPFLAPTAGIFGTMAGRAALSGGANILAQLSQEGSEGDFSGLSALLAAGTGALSAPGAGDTLRGIGKTPGVTGADAGFFVGEGMNVPQGSTSFLGKAADFAATGADKLQGIIAAGKADPFSMAGLKAASIPITQGTMDLGIAEARRTAKDLANDALNSLPEGASDADRALAIRQFMEAAGYFSEDEIVDTITAAGYADGGRVKLSKGGDPDFAGIKGAVISVDENMRADRAGDFFRLREEAIMKGDDDKIKEIESDFFKEFGFVMPKMAKDGGRINLREGGVSIFEQLTQPAEQNAPMFLGRPAFAPTLPQPIFPRLNQLEQGVNMAENKLTNIRGRLGNEEGRLGGLMAIQPSYGIQPAFRPLTGLLRIQDQLQELPSGPARGMKEGGMMDLGGKEMDLRKGGFVPIGKKERADDVPARLSKNEFVMTADAVRGAGGGDINKGAKRMYETMNRLEARA